MGHILRQRSHDVRELGSMGCDLLQREVLLGLQEPNVGFLVPEGAQPLAPMAERDAEKPLTSDMSNVR